MRRNGACGSLPLPGSVYQVVRPSRQVREDIGMLS